MNIKNKITLSYHNLRSIRTSRRFIAFQSDDWGAIRTPSRKVFNSLIKEGIPLNNDLYSCNDALERVCDLQDLFDVLCSITDSYGNHPNFTANYVVANPNFEAIKCAEYNEYYYENIITSYNRAYGENPIESICREAIREGIWTPQSHGREHLNVDLWMKCLSLRIPEIIKGFEHGMFAMTKSLVKNLPVSFMEALNSRTEHEENKLDAIITEGLELFNDIFNTKSISFIAPNYVWGNKVENILAKYDVKLIQSGRAQRLPISNGNKTIKRHTGSRNNQNQIYACRNCNFEPSSLRNPNKSVDECLAEIELAFKFKTPAIINSHRINYIGAINNTNNITNNALLSELLKQIIKTWPDVEFINISELNKILQKNQK